MPRGPRDPSSAPPIASAFAWTTWTVSGAPPASAIMVPLLELVVSTPGLLFDRIDELNVQLDEVDQQTRSIVREDEELRRLMTIPGVGEVGAMAVHAFAPAMESFARGRDFAAWIGLTPREISTGGRQRLGRITKMGQRELRQLSILGATSVIRHARRRKEIEDP